MLVHSEQKIKLHGNATEALTITEKPLQAILMSPFNDDAAQRRQAALTRVRQRRAQRVLGTEPSDPVAPATPQPPEASTESTAARSGCLTCPEPKVPKSFARTAPAVMMPEVEVNPVTWSDMKCVKKSHQRCTEVTRGDTCILVPKSGE